MKFKLEADVDDFVKETLNSLGLNKLADYNEKSAMSDYMKSALKGAAKTDLKTNYGQPDFTIEKYAIPVVIEDKLSNNKHIALSKDNSIKNDSASVKNYAVNGAVYYAQSMIASKKYKEVVAIGVSGESKEDIVISVYYVFSPSLPPKKMEEYNNLYFLQNAESFSSFYKNATITEEEKHYFLTLSRDHILKCAKKLNKLMDNFNIGVDQRVVYVSGMLLAMQDVLDKEGNLLDNGLKPDDLKGISTKEKRDSVLIMNQIKEFLNTKPLDDDKKEIMISSFNSALTIDIARDSKIEVNQIIGTKLAEESSTTKQIFTFLYEYIFLSIDITQGALDIMAEMYSTFLKYALSDGASLGKVLTPPYITSLMAKILDINKDSRVMDIATGSAAFLVAAMDLMINDANYKLGKKTTLADKEIDSIKKERLLGIEVDAKMYTLAAANMILRGDGSTHIVKADSFKTPKKIFQDFKANRLLLNPPFSAKEDGLPFFEFGLNNMEKGGLGAVIIQDAVGAGKAVSTVKRILKKHKMIASIKMPADLFIPNAIVQTSIYVFEAHTAHNFKYDKVKFIDFRNDGYKRTKRAIKDISRPADRYNDIYLIYKLGFEAVKNESFHNDLWDLKKVYCEGTISEKCNDWNFEKHIEYDCSVTDENHLDNISEHLSWQLKNKLFSSLNIRGEEVVHQQFKEFVASSVFQMTNATPSYDKLELEPWKEGAKFEYITRQSTNRGINQYVSDNGENGKHLCGTFSLGLMQMIFFYRERDWYAGQFVKKISILPKYSSFLNEYSGLYLETVLNGLSLKLLSVLVRDVKKTFDTSLIKLPVDKEGNIDFDYMTNYVKNQRNRAFELIKEYVYEESK